MTPEEMQARLLYRDGLMLVIDKPPGLPVHRGPKGVEAFEDYFDALRFGLPRPPSLAHRLDRDTTGCLVLGRHRKALALLGRLFKQGKIGKTYWAVVEGGPEADEGRIDIALSKRDETRGWWMKPDPDGLPSSTTWKVMGRSQAAPQALFSPPPCGEGSGVGSLLRVARTPTITPLPNPPPQGGREYSVRAARDHLITPGSHSHRSPAARINCACIAPRWAFRSSATRSTARRQVYAACAKKACRVSAARRCICMRARSSCRSPRTSRR